jgi:hypothetical protein
METENLIKAAGKYRASKKKEFPTSYWFVEKKTSEGSELNKVIRINHSYSE